MYVENHGNGTPLSSIKQPKNLAYTCLKTHVNSLNALMVKNLKYLTYFDCKLIYGTHLTNALLVANFH